jgi:beta-glucanase (GH16 family)
MQRAVVLLLVLVSVLGANEESWVDPDTPAAAQKTHVDGRRFDLIFSDEFNVDDRNFADGYDRRWTAIEHSDKGDGALADYHPNMATTHKGNLVITSGKQKKHLYLGEEERYDSAMLQSWNKFCFRGGVVEISATLPGIPGVPGLWPALWLMGNMGRATFEGSTEGIWPWTMDYCMNRTERKIVYGYGNAQNISACDANPGYGLNPYQGRGAPEIDMMEAQITSLGGTASHSTSLQITPRVPPAFRPPDTINPMNPYCDGDSKSGSGPASAPGAPSWPYQPGRIQTARIRVA